MHDLILIADDLTGAADTAAPFATFGMPTRLLLDHSWDAVSGVSAISTESRELESVAAVEAVRLACRRVRQAGLAEPILFKKIDSTLRGHVVGELRVFLKEFGIQRLVLSPAFPSQGRSTTGGRLFVRGVPLDRSDFRGPFHRGDLIRLFGGVGDLPVHHHAVEHVRGDPACLSRRLERPGIHIPDVEAGQDLTRVAGAALAAGIFSFCGSGGLGRALAECIASGPVTSHKPPDLAGPLLFVAGSLNPTTVEQVEALRARGVDIIEFSDKDDGSSEVCAVLHAGRDAVLSSQREPYGAPEARAIRDGIARAVGRIVAGTRPGLLVLTGGDIAAGVCRTLGAGAIRLQGEVEPGIPVGRLEGGVASGLTVVTKAGGFGDRETFVRLIDSTGRN